MLHSPVQQKAGHFSIALLTFIYHHRFPSGKDSFHSCFIMLLAQLHRVFIQGPGIFLYKVSMIIYPLSDCGSKHLTIQVVWQETAASCSYVPLTNTSYSLSQTDLTFRQANLNTSGVKTINSFNFY